MPCSLFDRHREIGSSSSNIALMLCAARAALRPGAPVFRGLATSRMAAPVKPKKESKFKQMAGNIGQVAWATLAALMGFQTYMTTVSCLSCWSEGD